MTRHLKSCSALGALAVVAVVATPSIAADLGGSRGGSIKDGAVYAQPAPASSFGGFGNCYFRGDGGYSFGNDPRIKFPVGNLDNTFSGTDPANPGTLLSSQFTQTTDVVRDPRLESTFFGEGGFGCGSGSHGIRAELVFGYHSDRRIDGRPGDFNVNNIYTGVPAPTAPINDPLRTSLRSYTLMTNVFKDLGRWGNVTPYIGAGVGIAYNQLSEVSFIDSPNLRNRITGNNDLSLAWSAMAGIGYQISERAIIDVGYRYIDFGRIASQRNYDAGFVNPRVRVDDIAAHEIKVGLRYHFNTADCCGAPAYAPLK